MGSPVIMIASASLKGSHDAQKTGSMGSVWYRRVDLESLG